jgi:hypothetical protein
MKKIVHWQQIQPTGVYVVKLMMRNFIPPEKFPKIEKNMVYTFVSGLTGVDRIQNPTYFDFVSATPDKIAELRDRNDRSRRIVNEILVKLTDAQPVTLRVPGDTLLSASRKLKEYRQANRTDYNFQNNRLSIEIKEEVDALET